MAEGTRMLQRRATQAQWDTSNYVLETGEIGVALDTGIIKVGNGVTPWGDLAPAFSSHYLPMLGKAADSNLLDGIDSSGYVKVGDPSIAADANTIARRTSAGRLVATSAIADPELTTLGQQTTAIASAMTSAINTAVPSSRLEIVSRTSTLSITLAPTDVASVVHFNSTLNRTVTIPTDANAAITVGSWIDIQNLNTGILSIAAEAGVTFNTGFYPSLVLLRGDKLRILKTAANTWVPLDGVFDSGNIVLPAPPSGITARDDACYYRMRNRIVHIYASLLGNFTVNQTIYTMPAGFKSFRFMFFPQNLDNGTQIPFSVHPDGVVRYSHSALSTGLFIHITYPASQ